MAFDFSTLITDRSPEDLQALRDLLSTPMSEWTEAEKAEFNLARSKGAYNYTDLNRVTEAMEYINERLTGYGYQTGYKKVEIPHSEQSTLPDGYTQLAWIESSGTQYVDTGFMPNQDTRVVADFELSASYSSIRGIFGVRDTNSASAPRMFVFWNNGSNSFRSDYFGTSRSISISTILGRYVVDKNKNITTIGPESISNSASSGQCTNNLFIFCVNAAGSANYFAPCRLWSCQVYDNGTLIRDYIPCSNPSGEVGLYDQVNGVFYGNAGTGTFSHGAVVITTPPAPQNLRQTGKTLESISLAWDAVISADGYKLYRDGVLIATQTATSYTDTGLLPSESHAYQVLAYNGEGDGALSKAIIMSTEQAYYVITPVFTAANFAQNPTTINTPILLSVAVSDEMVFLQPENLQSGEIYSGEAS